MTPPKVLTFLDNFRGHAQLSRVVLVYIQEIIVEVGRFFDDNGSWTLLAGKKAGEWRETAVAFKSTFAHSSGTVHNRACSVVLSDGKNTMGDWGDSKAVHQHKLIVGMDANEVFYYSENTPGFPKGNTARGEVILQWLAAEHSLLFPSRELHKPTHYPYSRQTPRRLDYLVVRKYHMHEGQVGEHRERAFSDHEPVFGSLRHDPLFALHNIGAFATLNKAFEIVLMNHNLTATLTTRWPQWRCR